MEIVIPAVYTYPIRPVLQFIQPHDGIDEIFLKCLPAFDMKTIRVAL
jgi:hypothetical protein